MVTLTEGMHDGEFIGELAMGVGYHIDAITLDTGNLVAGAVLGAIETGTGTAVAGTPIATAGGVIGNGTILAVTADAGVMAGVWMLECTATGATGRFKVTRPDGVIDGILTIGTAYNGGINLTVSDGANDWLVGDTIPVTVSYSGTQTVRKFVEHNPTATDGSQIAAGILIKPTNATAADVLTTALVRGPATVNRNDLVWRSGATAAQIARGLADLQALGIKAV